MNEEKKEYSVVGTVTIGTDEYRDLIESVKENEYKYEETRRESTNRYWEIDSLKKEVESLKQYKEYVMEKHRDSFKLWKLGLEPDDEDNEEER